MEQARPAYDVICDFFCMDLDQLGNIVKEDPDVIQSWFTQPLPFGGHYFLLDNSPAHNAFNKYDQILIVADHIIALKHAVGCEKKVFVLLNRPRKKFGGKSFATIAKSSPNPLPTDNGLQEMIEKLQAWCGRKGIQLPERLLTLTR